MPVHFIHDLGEQTLARPFEPAAAVCGAELRRAHEIVRPDSDEDVCPACLSWSRRNKFQNFRPAVEMSPSANAPGGAEAGDSPAS